MALRIAFGDTIFCMSPRDDDKKEDCILLEEFKSNSLQSRPGFAEIRIGKSRSIISSCLVVRSFTLKRKQIWSSFAFAPPFSFLRQCWKQVNQRLTILKICFFFLFWVIMDLIGKNLTKKTWFIKLGNKNNTGNRWRH